MKKFALFVALFTASIMFTSAKAQVSVGISVNIGSQPAWGPVGYDYVQYYYMPDIDVYYYVPTHRYVYLDGGRWIFTSALPVRYRNYDIYSSYKVVINEPKAYLHHDVHVVTYRKYKGNNGNQVIIRNSPDAKYAAVNKKYKKEEYKHGNGNSKEKDKNKKDKNK